MGWSTSQWCLVCVCLKLSDDINIEKYFKHSLFKKFQKWYFLKVCLNERRTIQQYLTDIEMYTFNLWLRKLNEDYCNWFSVRQIRSRREEIYLTFFWSKNLVQCYSTSFLKAIYLWVKYEPGCANRRVSMVLIIIADISLLHP